MMSETVYRYDGHENGQAVYEPIEPNPLDEIERLRAQSEIDGGRIAALLEHIQRIEGPTDIGLGIAAALNGESAIPELSGKCITCDRSYVYHAERWGKFYEAASMPLEWHPFKGEPS